MLPCHAALLFDSFFIVFFLFTSSTNATLHTSLSVDVKELQDQVISLTKQLNKANKRIKELEKEVEELESSTLGAKSLCKEKSSVMDKGGNSAFFNDDDEGLKEEKQHAKSSINRNNESFVDNHPSGYISTPADTIPFYQRLPFVICIFALFIFALVVATCLFISSRSLQAKLNKLGIKTLA